MSGGKSNDKRDKMYLEMGGRDSVSAAHWSIVISL